MKLFAKLFVCAALAGTVGCASQPASRPTTLPQLDPILQASHRSADERARDRFRHPKQTLEFFGLRPDMHVVEVWPGNGWYTKILAPLLRERGQLTVAQIDATGGDYAKRTVEGYRALLDSRPDLYDKVTVTTLAPPPAKAAIAPAGSADLVLTFRNFHNWMMFGWERNAVQAMYDALKPGGVLGIVEHRGTGKLPQDTRAASGYVNEDYAIQVIESAASNSSTNLK